MHHPQNALGNACVMGECVDAGVPAVVNASVGLVCRLSVSQNRSVPGAKLFFPEENPDLIASELRALWRV